MVEQMTELYRANGDTKCYWQGFKYVTVWDWRIVHRAKD